MQYQTLKAGDVRQPGDEFAAKQDATVRNFPKEHANKNFQPIWPNRIGQLILAGDLVATIYRRPLP